MNLVLIFGSIVLALLNLGGAFATFLIISAILLILYRIVDQRVTELESDNNL